MLKYFHHDTLYYSYVVKIPKKPLVIILLPKERKYMIC